MRLAIALRRAVPSLSFDPDFLTPGPGALGAFSNNRKDRSLSTFLSLEERPGALPVFLGV
jgi:hypothetical protein